MESKKVLFVGANSEAQGYMKDISIGVDIEDIGRFVKLDLEKNRSFFNRLYTHREMEYCLSKSNPYPHFAVRFAGKEAVIKLISGFDERISPNEIEILNDAKGTPVVNINNRKLRNIKVIISLSHCKDKAIAFAWGSKNGDR